MLLTDFNSKHLGLLMDYFEEKNRSSGLNYQLQSVFTLNRLDAEEIEESFSHFSATLDLLKDLSPFYVEDIYHSFFKRFASRKAIDFILKTVYKSEYLEEDDRLFHWCLSKFEKMYTVSPENTQTYLAGMLKHISKNTTSKLPDIFSQEVPSQYDELFFYSFKNALLKNTFSFSIVRDDQPLEVFCKFGYLSLFLFLLKGQIFSSEFRIGDEFYTNLSSFTFGYLDIKSSLFEVLDQAPFLDSFDFGTENLFIYLEPLLTKDFSVGFLLADAPDQDIYLETVDSFVKKYSFGQIIDQITDQELNCFSDFEEGQLVNFAVYKACIFCADLTSRQVITVIDKNSLINFIPSQKVGDQFSFGSKNAKKPLFKITKGDVCFVTDRLFNLVRDKGISLKSLKTLTLS